MDTPEDHVLYISVYVVYVNPYMFEVCDSVWSIVVVVLYDISVCSVETTKILYCTSLSFVLGGYVMMPCCRGFGVQVFCLGVDEKLSGNTMADIMASGYSRVLIYEGPDTRNIRGYLQVPLSTPPPPPPQSSLPVSTTCILRVSKLLYWRCLSCRETVRSCVLWKIQHAL